MRQFFIIFLLFLIVLSTSVSAAINARDDYGTPALASSASNANRYGVMLMPDANYTLYKVQKDPLHNPDDIGFVTIYNDNTTSIVGNATSWVGDNATFTVPVNLTKGYLYRIFDVPGATRTIRYGAIEHFPYAGTYNNFPNACYSTTGGNCETPHGRMHIVTWLPLVLL